MKQDEVRNILPGEVMSSKKEMQYDIEVKAKDYFPELGIAVEYNDDDTCCSVELDSQSTVLFQGQSLFERSYKGLHQWFASIDTDLLSDNSGFTSLQFGIGAYSEGWEEEPEKPAELIIVFEKGYYDDLIAQGIM